MAFSLRLIYDFFHLSYHSFKHSKMRTFLTMVGIFIGIAAVVSLVSLAQGLQVIVAEQFQSLGADKFFVLPGAGFGPSMSMGTAKLYDKDLETIRRVRGVEEVAGLMAFSEKIEFKNQKKTTFVIGVPTDESSEVIKSMSTFRVEEGRWFKQGERSATGIGYLLAHEPLLFDRPVKIDDYVVIRNRKFKVGGIIERLGNENDDTQVYIPVDDAKELFGKQDYMQVMVQVKPGADVEKVAEEVKRKLRNERGVKEGEEDFTVQTMGQLMKSFNDIFGVVQAIVVALASISLLVGGIGIMNTMYTSVLERTKEIGIMKAIGARNSHVMTLFLIESGLLGLAGGIVGVLIGAGMAKAVEIAMAGQVNQVFRADFPPVLILGSLAFSFVVGTISGVLPAKSAAEMSPVDALRYE